MGRSSAKPNGVIMEADTSSIKKSVFDHGERIIKLETVVERMDQDMKEQTKILGEVRDAVVGMKTVIKFNAAFVSAAAAVAGGVAAYFL